MAPCINFVIHYIGVGSWGRGDVSLPIFDMGI